jgi:hypothetical protein
VVSRFTESCKEIKMVSGGGGLVQRLRKRSGCRKRHLDIFCIRKNTSDGSKNVSADECLDSSEIQLLVGRVLSLQHHDFKDLTTSDCGGFDADPIG